MPLAPAFEGDFASSEASTVRLVMHFQYASISRGDNSIIEKLKAAGIDPDEYIQWFSLRNWDKLKKKATTPAVPSPPLSQSPPPKNETQQSNSTTNHYVISKSAPLENESNVDEHHDYETHSEDGSMAELTQERQNKDNGPTQIKQSDQGEVRPSVDSKLSPVGNTESKADTISAVNNVQNGASSDFPEPKDGRLDYVSEQLYIHTKLMIVDDRIVIIGSANLNDRSQLGNRDSEIAMVIEDTDLVPSKMNGQDHKAGRFAHTLRMQLFKEHLGLLKTDINLEDAPKSDLYDHYRETLVPNERTTVVGDATGVMTRQSSTYNMFDNFRYDSQLKAEDQLVLDPICDQFYLNVWKSAASSNTHIYRNVFRCVPDDNVHNFEDHRKFIPDKQVVPIGHIADPLNMNEQTVKDNLSKIQGHLVLFPKDYLKDENMVGSYIKETVTPMVIFT